MYNFEWISDLTSGKFSFQELRAFLDEIKLFREIFKEGFVLKRATHNRFCLEYETKDYFVARDKVRHFESEGHYAEMGIKTKEDIMSCYVNYTPPFVVSIYFPFVEKVAEKPTNANLNSLFKKEEQKTESDISPVFFDHICL